MRRLRWTAAAALLALGGVACGAQSQPDTAASTRRPSLQDRGTASPHRTEPPRGSRVLTLYYLVESRGRTWLTPERHRVPATRAVARAALDRLLRGSPQDPDHATPFPRGAAVASVAVGDGVATVDWNAETLEAEVGAEQEALGIQSVVWMLTEFPSIRRVRFTVERRTSGTASNGRRIEDWWGHVGLRGQPWSRRDAIEVLAPIVVDSPRDGSTVRPDALRVTGEAGTFEANVGLRLFDGRGRRIVHTSATATEGAPGRGRFSAVLRAKAPARAETWRLEVFESSAEDGRDVFVESRSLRVDPAG